MKRQLVRLASLGLLVVLTACQASTATQSQAPGSSSGSASAPAPASGAQAPEGGTLRISHGGDPQSLDPANIKTTQATQIALPMLETLTTFKNTGQLEGLLATSWESNATQDEWTFTLREGVTFTDGTPLNADAVAKSIMRSIDPSMTTTAAGSLRFIESAEAVDDSHVKFTLKQPIRYFPSALANVVGSITSPTSWTANGNTYALADNVVGTGPYQLTGYTKDDRVTMTRNDSYWGEKPAYKEQIFFAIPDAAAREAALRAGQVDVINNTSASSIDSLKADPGYTVLEKYGNRVAHIHLNTTSTANPALQDPRVRQALNYAVDKQAIIDNVLFGLGKQMDSPLGDETWFGYCQTGPYAYDPDKAKQLLSEAGASDLSLSMLALNGRWLQDSQTAEAVAGYLREVGVNVDGPKINDAATTLEILTAPSEQGNADPMDQSSYWSFTADFPDASQLLERNYATTSIPPNSGNNFSRYSNPTVDELLAKGAAEGDEATAEADYCEAEKAIWNDAPMIYLFSLPFVVVASNAVDGISVSPPNQVMNTIYATPKG